MNLRAEYEKHLAAQQALQKLDAKARSFGSTTSDRRRAAAARREADPKQFQKKVAEAYAQETRAINSIMPSELQAAVLALVRREMKNMLPHPLRGLTDNYTNYASPLIATLDSEGEAYWGPGDGGDSEGDYAFKITATEELDGNGDPYDPPKFTVNVLGGTAQTLGGTPYIYYDKKLVNVKEGWHIYVVYQNLESSSSYTEYGEWRPGIKASSAADMLNYTAPHDLVFEIGRISKEYIGNVRQGHKGNIVMPAISNVVDIQTQLP